LGVLLVLYLPEGNERATRHSRFSSHVQATRAHKRREMFTGLIVSAAMFNDSIRDNTVPLETNVADETAQFLLLLIDMSFAPRGGIGDYAKLLLIPVAMATAFTPREALQPRCQPRRGHGTADHDGQA
jgi:hypothetical protein